MREAPSRDEEQSVDQGHGLLNVFCPVLYERGA